VGSVETPYSCGTDGAFLVVEGPGVQGCLTCGLRTGAPATGLLADRFDVVHRQWGLRGDPHVWRALRERLTTVTSCCTPCGGNSLSSRPTRMTFGRSAEASRSSAP